MVKVFVLVEALGGIVEAVTCTAAAVCRGSYTPSTYYIPKACLGRSLGVFIDNGKQESHGRIMS